MAVPSLQTDLHAIDAAVQLVVAGYGLAFAAGLITGARLGDRWGRRRVFGCGILLFTLASAACGLAPTASTLVLARVVQGAAAALVSPQVLAILGTAYEGRDRARAFMGYAVAVGLAATCGQLIGGVLIGSDLLGLGWRSCFLVNVPIGAAMLLLMPRLVPEPPVQGGGRLDLGGAALVSLALVAIVLPLVEGRQLGWPAWSWPCLTSSLPLLLAFVAHQRRRRRRGSAPLVDPGMFRERAFSVGILTVLMFYAGVASFFFVLALYLQDGRGVDALGSGELFSAIGLGFFLASTLGSRPGRRLGRHVPTLGALVLAAGLAALAGLVRWGSSVPVLVPALLVIGLGMGMVMAPLVSAVLASAPPAQVGGAAGVVATAQQVGSALGVAGIGILFYGTLATGSYAGAFGASLGFVIAIALAIAGLVQLVSAAPPAAAGDR